MIDWEAAKDQYQWAAYCPKKNKIFLIKECHTFQGKEWFTYADGKLFGKFIRTDRTSTWIYLGKLGKSKK